MPSAETMRAAHQKLVDENRGAGLMGLAVQAQQAPAIKALTELINADKDPRKGES